MTLSLANLLIVKLCCATSEKVIGHMSPNEPESALQVTFRRSSFCGSTECIEVALQENVVILRDSAQPNGNMLHYTVEGWRSFVRNIKAGGLSDPRE
jgi:hypothetical protein